MKNTTPRDALGIVVSIDSAIPDGYEIVSSRKVEKDVYELVLARPKKKAPSTDGVVNGVVLPIVTEEADSRSTTAITPAATSVSSISTTWVVKSPQKVQADQTSIGGRAPSVAETGDVVSVPVEDSSLVAPDDVESVVDTALTVSAVVVDDAPSLVGPDADNTVAATSAPPPSVPSTTAGLDHWSTDVTDAPLDAPATRTETTVTHADISPPPGATAAHPITGGPDLVNGSAAKSAADGEPTAEAIGSSTSELGAVVESASMLVNSTTPGPSAASTPPGASTPVVDAATGLDSGAAVVRVAPREVVPPTDQTPSQLTALIADAVAPTDGTPAVDEQLAAVDVDESSDSRGSSAKRRPFSRAPKDESPAPPTANKKATPSVSAGRAPSKSDAARRLPFTRAKDTTKIDKTPPKDAPIRPATNVRPRVEIDPRTGRPVHDQNSPLIDARTRPSTPRARSDAASDAGSDTRESTGATGSGKRPPNKFQDELIRQGLVTESQLDEAYQTHLKTGRHLFFVLHESGVISEDSLAEEVAKFYHLPMVDLSREDLDPSALDLVTERIARTHMVFPISIMPDGLYVAVAEPSEKLAGLLLQTSGQSSAMAVAAVSDVNHAIETNYHALTGVAELVQEFEAGEVSQRRQATTQVADLADETAPIVQVVNRILSQAIRDGASDVHIEPADDYVRIRNRVDGVLKVVLVLPAAMGLGLVSRIKIMADMNIVERRRPQDGKFTSMIDGKEVDVRVATVATIWGENCVLRILDKTRSVLSINDLGMADDTHQIYSKLIRSPFGMVLCVGPTGSGKTTTLYASLTEISDVARNVMTIEDPVEYVFPSINQIQTNEQAGLTFATGLKSILRQDSDIVLVGEIRDVETARIAVQSTLTGHFVLSSLHATDAISALTRFIDMGIESFLIASSVLAIVGQRLVRRTCVECKEIYTPTDEEMAFYVNSGGPPKDVFYRGVGCNFCAHTGFRERIGVYELCAMTPEMKRLIVGFATEDELRDLAKRQGMRSIQDEAVALIAKDLTTSAEVVRSIYSI